MYNNFPRNFLLVKRIKVKFIDENSVDNPNKEDYIFRQILACYLFKTSMIMLDNVPSTL